MKETYSEKDLIDFRSKHELFIGLDSDGCVFDSMSVKQRIFRRGLIEVWELQDVEAEADRLAEWVALYSPWRGLNRFQLILKIFKVWDEYLPGEGKPRPVEALSRFVVSGVPLSMTELKAWNDPELQEVYNWSLEASRQIAAIRDIPVFDEVEEGLKVLHSKSDIIVVSQTTEEALVREWRNAGLEKFIDVIAGAELGSKAESLIRAARGRYPLDRIIMVGDAFGDLEAAETTGCLFFPIIPGEETGSWLELRTRALRNALNGTFAGEYQADLISRFNHVLSPQPPEIG